MNFEKWDKIIVPNNKWHNLYFKDIWKYRDLIFLFVHRDFISTHKQTILGPFWHIIKPLLTAIIYTVIFGNVVKIPTDGIPPMLFYLSGIACWNYFTDLINQSSGTFIDNANIFGKVYFPRLTVPVSIVISRLINFGIQFGLFICFLVFFSFKHIELHLNTNLLLLPILLIIIATLGMGLGIIISSLSTKYRDLAFLITFGLQLLMFTAPVIYPLSAIPEKYKFYIIANPMTSVIETFRYSFFGNETFRWEYLLYSGILSIIIFVIGILLFNKVERTFMDTV